MIRRDMIQKIKGILLGLILVLGISVAVASWNPPSGTPSADNNEQAPINVGSAIQDKNGTLGVKHLTGFDTSSFLGQVDFGSQANLSDVLVWKLSVQNPVNNSVTYPAPVCVDDQGKLQLCAASSAPVPTISANPTSLPAGGGTTTVNAQYSGDTASCMKSSSPSSSYSGSGTSLQPLTITTTTTFTINCGGLSASTTVTVATSVPAPTVTLNSALDQFGTYDGTPKSILNTVTSTNMSQVSATDSNLNDKTMWFSLATTNVTSCTYSSTPSGQYSSWDSKTATTFDPGATSMIMTRWGTNTFTVDCQNSAGVHVTKTVSFIVKGKMIFDVAGSWATPANISQFFFELWGAGGGGGGGGGGAGGNSSAESGGGGGGGESGQYNSSNVLSASGTYTLTIGTAGTPGTFGNGAAGSPAGGGFVGASGTNTSISGNGLSLFDTIAEGGSAGLGGQGGDQNGGTADGGAGGNGNSGVGDNRVAGSNGIAGHTAAIAGCGIDNDNSMAGDGGIPLDPNASSGGKGVGASGGSGGQVGGSGCGTGGNDGLPGGHPTATVYANSTDGRVIIYWPSM